MKFLASIWKDHGTKVLGYLAAAIPALLTVEGLIPDPQRKYWTALGVLLGLLIVQRGHSNGKTQP